MLSTRSCTSCGASGAVFDTAKATAKLTSAPIAPNALGVMPRNQFGSIPPRKLVLEMNRMPLCWNT